MNLSILARCGLFRGIETAELSPLLRRLHACTREFDKFQPIYRVGDTAHALCILLSGGVNIERCDAWGHKTLLDHITPGSVFAETYACVPGTPMMVSAVADEPSEVLFLPSERCSPLPRRTARTVCFYAIFWTLPRRKTCF